ncbi:MAG: AAA family ATPase [Rhodobacteraceae bacterium]|nr:AAA family ATPase [Paracoccaceae bacterium]
MRVLYANFKGGTGKSTIVFNLALWQQEQGHTVQVCDLDPQRTVSDVAAIRTEDGIEPSLDVVNELPARKKKGVQYLIDVGASDMEAMRAAIRAADRVVIPVTPSQADIWATQRFLEIMREERPKGKLPPVLAFLNRADPHPRSRENAEALEALSMLRGVTPVATKLVQRLAFRRSFSEGLSVRELEPGSKAASELDTLARAVCTD